MRLIVHPRIQKKHPNLSEKDVRYAWEHSYYEALRIGSPNFSEYLWIGEDASGRKIEIVGVLAESGWLVSHANTPLSKSVRAEIARNERSRR